MCISTIGIAGLLNPTQIGFVFGVGNLIAVFHAIDAPLA
tara:strand:+ start:779 stop:895 length:117 start_codon:yes stop_codon:yes gene_type:complete